MLKRAFSYFLVTLIAFAPEASYAQTLLMPEPGVMVTASPAYVPMIFKGMSVHPENPLLFDFIVDTGNSGFKAGTGNAAIKEETNKLVKYFLASLTIPPNDQWVNLSPFEKDRMLPVELGKTEMGRDMLAQDYLLKQVMASFIDPDKTLGKEFWARVYDRAQKELGTTEVPVDTFNKVWITAEKADVFVRQNTAFVVGSHLKVMLESDYLAQKNAAGVISTDTQELSKKVIRDIVLPELEKEVNTGRNFANLRQIFHSMILATWYKKNLKQALLTQVYADQKKTNGVEGLWVAQKGADIDPEQIWSKYEAAYKKGVFNFIREDVNQATGEPVARKYFSGGLTDMAAANVVTSMNPSAAVSTGEFFKVTAWMGEAQDASMFIDPDLESLRNWILAEGEDGSINVIISQINKRIHTFNTIQLSEIIGISNKYILLNRQYKVREVEALKASVEQELDGRFRPLTEVSGLRYHLLDSAQNVRAIPVVSGEELASLIPILPRENKINIFEEKKFGITVDPQDQVRFINNRFIPFVNQQGQWLGLRIGQDMGTDMFDVRLYQYASKPQGPGADGKLLYVENTSEGAYEFIISDDISPILEGIFKQVAKYEQNSAKVGKKLTQVLVELKVMWDALKQEQGAMQLKPDDQKTEKERSAEKDVIVSLTSKIQKLVDDARILGADETTLAALERADAAQGISVEEARALLAEIEQSIAAGNNSLTLLHERLHLKDLIDRIGKQMPAGDVVEGNNARVEVKKINRFNFADAAQLRDARQLVAELEKIGNPSVDALKALARARQKVSDLERAEQETPRMMPSPVNEKAVRMSEVARIYPSAEKDAVGNSDMAERKVVSAEEFRNTIAGLDVAFDEHQAQIGSAPMKREIELRVKGSQDGVSVRLVIWKYNGEMSIRMMSGKK
ncbi:MAG: hypothetical protein HQL17_07045, partial [Candidatus Omnitrophica bacterium]|nr:hypothetical protein [Candidatus Omnitrophota bacterium]